MEKALIFIFLLLLVVPFISAQPPQSATQVVINLEAGLGVDFPKFAFLEQKRDFTFFFHVFNSTTGLRVDNSTVNCTFELSNNVGLHLIKEENINFTGTEWEIFVLGSNFTRLGSYFWFANCQSDEEGGFISSAFEVTADGFEPKTFPIQLSIIILSFVLVFVGLIKERFRLIKHVGSIMLMIMGVLTLYPGFSFINHSTLLGLSLGFILIGGGFYFLIEDSFSRKEQQEYYEQEQEESE